MGPATVKLVRSEWGARSDAEAALQREAALGVGVRVTVRALLVLNLTEKPINIRKTAANSTNELTPPLHRLHPQLWSWRLLEATATERRPPQWRTAPSACPRVSMHSSTR